MKIKVITGSMPEEIEGDFISFIKNTPNIHIEHVVQSESNLSITLTILYTQKPKL